MYKIVRRVMDISDSNNEIILSETSNEYIDLSTAIFELGKARKADRAMYRIALREISWRKYNCICDDWYSDTAYMFRIENTCIECKLEDEIQIALEMYRLEVD